MQLIFAMGYKLEETNLIDTMIKDGLWDAFNGYHMGVTAENVANQNGTFTEKIKTNLPWSSQNKAEKAQKEGKFKNEISSSSFKSKNGDNKFES